MVLTIGASAEAHFFFAVFDFYDLVASLVLVPFYQIDAIGDANSFDDLFQPFGRRTRRGR